MSCRAAEAKDCLHKTPGLLRHLYPRVGIGSYRQCLTGQAPPIYSCQPPNANGICVSAKALRLGNLVKLYRHTALNLQQNCLMESEAAH